ncbi:MAG: hypothetical protein ACREDO_09345 [Methyloceanibacter sp.]
MRIEIESALTQKKRGNPVLVNDAKMPGAKDRPKPLAALARCNAVRLSHDRFRADMQGLIKSLERVLAEAERARLAKEEERHRKAEAEARADAERREAHSERARRLQLKAEEEAKAETERRKTLARNEAQPLEKPHGASYFGNGNGYRAAAVLLAVSFALATLGILAWRRSRLRRREFAVYATGLAYLVLASGLLK